MTIPPPHGPSNETVTWTSTTHDPINKKQKQPLGRRGQLQNGTLADSHTVTL